MSRSRAMRLRAVGNLSVEEIVISRSDLRPPPHFSTISLIWVNFPDISVAVEMHMASIIFVTHINKEQLVQNDCCFGSSPLSEQYFFSSLFSPVFEDFSFLFCGF